MCSGVGRPKESSAKQCICLECFRTLFVKPIIPLQLLSFITRSSCSLTSTLARINNQRCPANDAHCAVEAKEQAPLELQQPCRLMGVWALMAWESEGVVYLCLFSLTIYLCDFWQSSRTQQNSTSAGMKDLCHILCYVVEAFTLQTI